MPSAPALAETGVSGTIRNVTGASRAFVSFSTDDSDDFLERLSPVIPPIHVRAEGRSFAGSAKIAPLSQMGLFVAKLRQTRVLAETLGAIYSVNIPLTGPLELRRGQRSLTLVPGKAYVIAPGDELDLLMPGDSSVLVANIRAESIAYRLTGTPSSAT